MADPLPPHGHAAGEPEPGGGRQAGHLRPDAEPPPARHHHTRVVRLGARRTALQRFRGQRRARQALAHADRADALLPRSRLDAGHGRGPTHLPPTVGLHHPLRRAVAGHGQLRTVGPGAGGRAVHHCTQQVGHPLPVLRQPPHAHPGAWGPDDLDEPAGRRDHRRQGQRVGRGLQPQRRRRRACHRLPSHPARHGLHVPRPGTHDEHAADRVHR